MLKEKDGSFDCIMKLLIIGDPNVGKTNILLRACDNKFVPTYLGTIGMDLKVKNLEIDGRKIRMQVWDTAGQDRFRTITQSYYKGAHGIIMSYAINDKNSFHNIDMWMKQIKEHASEGVCIMLVATKCDLTTRVVDYSEGKRLADFYEVPFLETSAKNDVNIEETFDTIARLVKERMILKNESIISLESKGTKLRNFSGEENENGMDGSNCTC